MTDGKIDIARLVGAGKSAPLRSAALRLIGTTTCREKQPVCDMCPLRDYCASNAVDLGGAADNQPVLLTPPKTHAPGNEGRTAVP
jgi:DNA (cytosine-5)-methyltransferase 1